MARIARMLRIRLYWQCAPMPVRRPDASRDQIRSNCPAPRLYRRARTPSPTHCLPKDPTHAYRIQTSREFACRHAACHRQVQNQPVSVMTTSRSELHGQSRATIAQFTYSTLRPGCCLMAAQAAHGHRAAKSRPSRYVSVHIRQGELDGARGQHCLLMALTIFGVQPRGSWDVILSRGSGAYQALAKVLKANFFSGMFLDDAASCVDAAPVEISDAACRLRSNRSARYVERFCLKHLCAGSLVMVVVLTSPHATGHWTLIVGREEEQISTGATRAAAGRTRQHVPLARALLCLDPCAPAPTINAYNARLDLTSRSGELQKYQ